MKHSFLILFVFLISNVVSAQESPYGTCSHLAGGEEHDAMPANLQKMAEAGIRWARADFTWSGIERVQGKWTFDHLDRVLDQAEANGITVLPILDYHTSWAVPAYQHPAEWLEYVRRTVTRYHSRIRYWEVWNEQNLKGFWADDPNPAAYAEFLKATYQTIKEIDPELVVVYGGLAGVPREFLEKSLEAGAGKYFDVMNIHPYRGSLNSLDKLNAFRDDLDWVRAQVANHGGDRPLWITEMGWATPPVFGSFPVTSGVIRAAFDQIYPEGFPKDAAAGVIQDRKYLPGQNITLAAYRRLLPEGVPVRGLAFWEIQGLDVETVPVLMMPPSEEFPKERMADFQDYVRRGGTLILTGGVPVYYDVVQDETARWVRAKNDQHGDVRPNALRIGWYAWWTRKGTPERGPLAAPEATAKFFSDFQSKQEGTRFLDDSCLKSGDRMIPLLNVRTDSFEAPIAALYRFNSDWRGNVLVCTYLGEGNFNTNQCFPEEQGMNLSQAILVALSCGVDRYFCYEFQAPERDDIDPESHFGITHRDLTPKTGYLAYQTLTRMRPAGSVTQSVSLEGSPCTISWRRPDGDFVTAIWSVEGPWSSTFNGNQKVVEVLDHLGNPDPACEISPDGRSVCLNVEREIKYVRVRPLRGLPWVIPTIDSRGR